ncbi:MAG TPA: amino acid racemase [Candidatus Saccharimonadales bacterium]
MKQLRDKRIGIVGGMGPAAGHYFAQTLTSLVQAARDQDHPVIIHLSDPSIPDRTAFLTNGGKDPVPSITRAIKQLEACGADVICIPCNTAHAPQLFNRYSRYVRTPIIHMVNETVDYIAAHYPKTQRIGILGTDGTRAAGSYDIAALRHELQICHPADDMQHEVMRLIYTIKRRGVRPGDGRALARAANNMDVDVFVVACTELSMLTDECRKYIDLPVVDSLEVLAQTALGTQRKISHHPVQG